MIVKTGNKYVVKSENGSKRLSHPTTHAAAVKRLRQVEYFKAADRTKKAARSYSRLR